MATTSLARSCCKGGRGPVVRLRAGESSPVGRSLSAFKQDGQAPLQRPCIEGLTAAEKKIVALHEEACAAGQKNYVDPVTGYLVLTKVAHLERGNCCGSSCRHYPEGSHMEAAAVEYKTRSNGLKLLEDYAHVSYSSHLERGILWYVAPKRDALPKIMFATCGFCLLLVASCPYGQTNVKDPSKKKRFNSFFYA